MAERLYILDAHSLIYQVFHAIDEMTAPNGMPTNAVFGFVRDIQQIRQNKKPDYFLCAFDAPGDTFRHALDVQYKANRTAMPDDLRPQIAMILKILEAYRIPILSEPGLEADDFLATVAFQCHRRKIQAYLCTADKDVRQCITDFVNILDLRRNRIIDANYLAEDWGIRPEQVIDYQSMVGDSVDNVPGIKGVGPKTASQLLQKYGTLEAIFEHIDEVPGKKAKENLYAGRNEAIRCRDLVRLKTDIPLPEDWSAYKPQTPDYPRLLELFAECGFHRYVDELRAEMPSTGEATIAWQADYIAVVDAAGLEDLLKQLAEQSRISFDLETTSLSPVEAEIVGYAISWEPGRAYFVSVRAPEGETQLDPGDTLDKLRPILTNPEIEKVGQNLKYDIAVLRAAGVELAGVAFDTMVASYLLEPGERNHNLDELSQKLLSHETIKITELIGDKGKGKTQKLMSQVPVARIAEYAGEDAVVALRLTHILEPRIKNAQLDKLAQELEFPLIEVLAEMEYHGIRVDPKRLKEMSADFADRLERIEIEAHQLAGHEFNLDSPTQLRKVLFDELKLPVIKRTPSGPSTDQEVLEELADRHPLCEKMLQHRQFSKLKGTYLDALPQMISPKTGRIHASFSQVVAATGRLSSSDPNLQNIPVRSEEGRQIRQAFLPRAEGMVLLSADYSQIELRLLAHYSGDDNLCRAFAEDKDIHAAVAAGIQGVEIDKVDSEMRRRAKAVNFGIMYGLSPYGLARQLKITQDDAAVFIDNYFAQYPAIEKLFTKILEGALKNRFVTTIMGRRRPISGIKATTGRTRNLPERTAINTVIQGSAADLIKKAMLNIHRRLKTEESLGARMLLQIHDELVFEVPTNRVGDLTELVCKEMVEAIPLSNVPLKVDIGYGPNWLDQQSLEVASHA